MGKEWLFDRPGTIDFTIARQAVIRRIVDEVRKRESMASALDVGCGVGYFAQFLRELNFSVVAVDGREDNIIEAQSRYPGINFRVADAEFLPSAGLGAFDFVLCAGLLYHLENPFRVIRNLHALTEKILFVESAIASGEAITLNFMDEPRLEDQGLHYIALYPTEPSLIKMLYRAGFPFVYTFATLPAFHLFQDSASRKRERTLIVASKKSLDVNGLVLTPEPHCAFDFWSVPPKGFGPRRMLGFLRWLTTSSKRSA